MLQNSTPTQLTQLHYVTRNGKLDPSFALSVRKAQASKYAKLVLKQALRGSLYLYTRWYDDVNKTNYLADMFGSVETEAEQVLSERRRNYQGQFIAQPR